MPATKVAQTPSTVNTSVLSGLWPTLAVISVIVLLHLLTNGRYGFYRDELQFMSDSRRLDWGYVAYPPIAPLLARISMNLFGLSLIGLRSFSVLALAAALFVTAQMARDLGGGRLAQGAAALAAGLSPYPLYEGTVFWYTSFDYLWWVLAAYFTIRLLKSENPRWWLAIGAIEGLGLLTKYTMAYLIAGILCGVLFTRARGHLTSGWFWGGSALALLICMPNIVWQFRHDFISFSFLQFVHTRDIDKGLTDNFLIEQLMYCVNLFAIPVWLAGLIGYLRSQRYQMIAWMYIIPLVLFIATKGRTYYLAPAYPMLIAMGSVMGERWMNGPVKNSSSVKQARSQARTAKLNRQAGWSGRQWACAVFFTGLVLLGALICSILLPFQSKGPLRDFALRRNELLRDEFGWNELVSTVAGIRDSLPPDQQAHLGIMVANYGEDGAMEILGSAHHLPPPISTINSGWFRGYPLSPPTTLIVIGFSGEMARALFAGCTLAGHNINSEHIINKETEHSDIFLCGPPRRPWPDFWKDSPHFE
jgi:hypothetical protein